MPARYRECFSPERPLPRDVEYIPYRHAISQAKRRLQRLPLVYLALSVVWIVIGSFELVSGSPRMPVLLGAMVATVAGFAAWNVSVLARMRRGHPSGSVWRYGLFLWPDALVVLPTDGPVLVVPVDAIDSVQQDREQDVGTTHSRIVRITAEDDAGELVSITIDDLGAMPAPHLVRAIETWRTGVEPELLAPAPTAVTPPRKVAVRTQRHR